ncbi:hypothetical protein L484_006331 [Morus notabilis]|uniref:Uncharacterized protein n=1 Tax=Morus notabilis TaxID=981085 RepID=W9SAL5_9ROSA|nr:hypothetical protein L484_006331 [Morus notabilis]
MASSGGRPLRPTAFIIFLQLVIFLRHFGNGDLERAIESVLFGLTPPSSLEVLPLCLHPEAPSIVPA